MLLATFFFVLFVASYGAAFSSQYQPPYQNNSTGLHRHFADVDTSRRFGDADHFKETRNLRTPSHLMASMISGRRNLIEMYFMVGCATNCDRVVLLNYGRYCGWGGSGTPIDDTDRCCQIHDDCYGRVHKDSGSWFGIMYFRSYRWSCNNGVPSCSTQQHDKWRSALCDCDLKLVNCFKKFGCPTVGKKLKRPNKFV